MFKAVVRVHSVAISGALATSVLTYANWYMGAIHESINDHANSFAFVRVHSKFVKDIVPSRSNVSDITQKWH